jgi:integrase
VRVNAATAVDPPRAPRKEITVLDSEQTRHLLNIAAQGQKIAPLVTILAMTGMRIGEALALRWRDLDLRAGTIKVNRTLVEIRGQFSFQEPKSNASRREVGIPQEAVDVLRALRSRIRGLPHPERLVFTDSRGGPLRRSNLIRRDWHPLLKLANLPKTGIHSLRHSHATQLLAAGANPRAVADRLGHSRASLVLDVYGHVLPGADRELTDQMGALLRSHSV